MNSNLTLCLGTLFHQINHFECIISRIIGSIIIVVSLFSILFNIRFLYWSSYHKHGRSRHYPIILSMIILSISVIIVTTPSVLIQCLYCYRWCSAFYCRLEGFINYLNGCNHMFMLMTISIIRYFTVRVTYVRKRYFEQHSYIAVMFSWLLGLVFALPPLFNWNKYVPEGIGFHCGLNWFDRSISSRLYFILAFSFIYFIPLIVLLGLNTYIYYVIRRLLYRTTTVTKFDISSNPSDQKRESTSIMLSSTSSGTIKLDKSAFILPVNSLDGNKRLVIRRGTDHLEMNHRMRLNRLKVDRRFALATMFLASEYLLSWTPYAVMALFYLFNIEFISQQSVLMTICAFIAKISMILNPFIYIATVKTSQLKSILCFRTYLCTYCCMKKNIVVL